ncbi:hypothetical protein MtrunA17_Chr6g0486501 [Medicago truncatula]|uniref:Uncharacterized protein n=1 Tax=Medicago truncatula TaxID=3880 RepID=A0A396HM70_MEDTR|nr:hypothetical protein MtrunA17_Chr6g0486501 [Medicago truncatula]
MRASSMYLPILPSAASLPDFLSADERPFVLRSCLHTQLYLQLFTSIPTSLIISTQVGTKTR